MRALIAVVGLVCLLSPVRDWALDQPQVIATALQSPVDPQMGQHRNERAPDEVDREREMAKQRNKDRQQKLKDDTDKLLKLATELKEFVDKSNEHVLSLDVLKKTDEIEKLAKSVRDKMKAGSYDGVVQ